MRLMSLEILLLIVTGVYLANSSKVNLFQEPMVAAMARREARAGGDDSRGGVERRKGLTRRPERARRRRLGNRQRKRRQEAR
jgi:hypothetical protein